MHSIFSLALAAVPLAAGLPAGSGAGSHQLFKPSTVKQDAQFTFEPFTLTNLDLGCNRNSSFDMFSCHLQFNWQDPNSVKQNNVTSGTCSSTWSWDGETSESGPKNTYPTQFLMCFEALPTFFEMKFQNFISAKNFTLDLAHRYKDSENFSEPYIYPTTWARPTFILPVVKEEDNALKLHSDGPAPAKVIGISN